ncbi:hypothetical protein [Salipiger sp. H15]
MGRRPVEDAKIEDPSATPSATRPCGAASSRTTSRGAPRISAMSRG